MFHKKILLFSFLLLGLYCVILKYLNANFYGILITLAIMGIYYLGTEAVTKTARVFFKKFKIFEEKDDKNIKKNWTNTK